MKPIILFSILFLVASISLCFSEEVQNADEPLKGELYFQLEKIWQIESAGDDLLANVKQILVSDDDTVYIHDGKNMRYYIVDSSGQFISAFGTRGEGPGEIQEIDQAPMYLAGTKIAVQDNVKLHYFNKKGQYIRSVVNNEHQRMPIVFLNEDEFISTPRTFADAPDGKGIIRIINLKTGQEKILTEFSAFDGGAVQTRKVRARVTAVSLIPTMIVGYHQNFIYYGMNDRYKVFIATMEGKILKSFSLTRERRRISDKVKKDKLFKGAKGKAPIELLETLAKQMPNDITHFCRIELHKGLIYLYMSYYDQKNIQQIDIFSQEGKYLYRSFIKIARGDFFAALPEIKGDYLYLALENEDGEHCVCKYKIPLPGK